MTLTLCHLCLQHQNDTRGGVPHVTTHGPVQTISLGTLCSLFGQSFIGKWAVGLPLKGLLVSTMYGVKHLLFSTTVLISHFSHIVDEENNFRLSELLIEKAANH